MSASPAPYDNLWQYFRDAGLCFVIMIGGLVLARVIAEPFREVTDLAYPIAMWLGLVPTWWFTRRCKIHDFDFYDYVAFSMIFGFVSVVRDMIVGANQRNLDAIARVIAMY